MALSIAMVICAPTILRFFKIITFYWQTFKNIVDVQR